MTARRFTVGTLLAISILGSQGCAAAVLAGGGLVGYHMHLTHEERKELHEINMRRTEAGLPPLTAEQYRRGVEPSTAAPPPTADDASADSEVAPESDDSTAAAH